MSSTVALMDNGTVLTPSPVTPPSTPSPSISRPPLPPPAKHLHRPHHSRGLRLTTAHLRAPPLLPLHSDDSLHPCETRQQAIQDTAHPQNSPATLCLSHTP